MVKSVLWAPLLLVVACGGGDDSSSTAGSDGGTGGTGGGTGANASVKSTCVTEINNYRATLGLPAYTEWTDGETCADGEAKSDSESGKAHGAFGTCQEFAQDECPGWPGDNLDTSIKGCLKMMWAEGPGSDFSTHGHYLNMSNKGYTQAACGFHVTPDGQMWSVQNFK
ncbi:MAG: CAP domain-containing protein [Polyangiaceae bacterium]